jgi:hypothetical protein
MLVNFYQQQNSQGFTNMGTLTDVRLRTMKPNGKIQKVSDGDILYAYIRPKSISWQIAYRVWPR